MSREENARYNNSTRDYDYGRSGGSGSTNTYQGSYQRSGSVFGSGSYNSNSNSGSTRSGGSYSGGGYSGGGSYSGGNSGGSTRQGGTIVGGRR
jgi:keratin, type I cytoskeletal 10